MARHQVISIKSTDPIASRLKSGTVVRMSDGWSGKVCHDDGKTITFIRDGAKQFDPQFVGYRGVTRQSLRIGGFNMIGRTPVVDCCARKVLKCSITVVDRARLESEWQSAPEI